MLPLLLFPQYLKDTTMLFVITLIAAIAVEECQLHRRIALNVLSRTGGRFAWSLAAFALSTAFISFWMVDTAATALMIPIAIAALEEMEKGDAEASVTESAESSIGRRQGHVGDRFEQLPRRDRGIWKCMVLMCGHASLIGGTGTITATGPNLIFRDNIQSWYPEGQTGVRREVGPVPLRYHDSYVDAARPRLCCRLGRPNRLRKKVILLIFTPPLPTCRKMISDTCIGIFVVFLFFACPRECPDFFCFRKGRCPPYSTPHSF
uniref:CitMHS domain-containing protein n=1 Tax=Steinernema glaseri TaxID=37863 RepID=A0A1I7YQ86_9BILA